MLTASLSVLYMYIIYGIHSDFPKINIKLFIGSDKDDNDIS